MKKQRLMLLIEGYFKGMKQIQDVGDYLEETIFGGSYVVADNIIALNSIKDVLDECLKDDWFELFISFYDEGKVRIADHEELVSMGAYEDRGDGRYLLLDKSVDITKADSYSELTTLEEVLDHYYPDLFL